MISSLLIQSDRPLQTGWAEIRLWFPPLMKTWSAPPPLQWSPTHPQRNVTSSGPLPWGTSSMSVLLNNTHTYTPAHTNTNTHKIWTRGPWGGRGMWYGNPCPLISSSDNYVWRSFVPWFGTTVYKSLWNWHDGYSPWQLLPPGLSRPSPPPTTTTTSSPCPP